MNSHTQPNKKPMKPHLRRQARQEAAAAEAARVVGTFSIRAHEATLIRGETDLPRQLEGKEGQEPGGRLQRWNGILRRSARLASRDGMMTNEEDELVWVDRHDILHLLGNLSVAADPGPSSPSASSAGWTDLPSDAEDTFFFSEDEDRQSYERVKKRRRIDVTREERLKALRDRERVEDEYAREQHDIENSASAQRSANGWGGDDEEPPPAVLHLMAHTLAALKASPNPQVLELRILTNHASDRRFAFLKGRYRNAWQAMKDGKPQQSVDTPVTSQAVPAKVAGLGGLMGAYGDSDNDSDSEDASITDGKRLPDRSSPPPPLHKSNHGVSDKALAARPSPRAADTSSNETAQAEAISGIPEELVPDEEAEKLKAKRRERAREWALKRKALGDGGAGSSHS